MRAPVVEMSEAAADLMLSECRASIDGNETGGILLGHDNAETILVTIAGSPGPDAERTPTSFKRDLAHAQALAERAYATDDSLWIGEWHTHPRGPAVPSVTDLSTYRTLLTSPELGFERVLSVIVTPDIQGQWESPQLQAFVVQLWAEVPEAVTVTACELRSMTTLHPDRLIDDRRAL